MRRVRRTDTFTCVRSIHGMSDSESRDTWGVRVYRARHMRCPSLSRKPCKVRRTIRTVIRTASVPLLRPDRPDFGPAGAPSGSSGFRARASGGGPLPLVLRVVHAGHGASSARAALGSGPYTGPPRCTAGGFQVQVPRPGGPLGSESARLRGPMTSDDSDGRAAVLATLTFRRSSTTRSRLLWAGRPPGKIRVAYSQPEPSHPRLPSLKIRVASSQPDPSRLPPAADGRRRTASVPPRAAASAKSRRPSPCGREAALPREPPKQAAARPRWQPAAGGHGSGVNFGFI